MKKQCVLVVGSSNTDMIVKVSHIPRPGETILGGEFATAAGGKGANQAVGAARAGGQVAFIARIGRDTLGDQALAGFSRAGINVDYIVRDRQAPSGVALIFVAADGENSIAVAPGANAKLGPSDLARAKPAFERAAVVVLQLETPLETVSAAAELAVASGARVILNPAPAQPLPDKMLNRVYLLTPNETEAEMLTGVRITGKSAAARASDVLLERGVQNVIITLGSRGAFLAGGGVRQHVPAFQVQAVDTTGAGDIFNGALAVGLAEGKPLVEAARFASAAAALSVTRLGAQSSAPNRVDIESVIGQEPKRRNANPHANPHHDSRILSRSDRGLD